MDARERGRGPHGALRPGVVARRLGSVLLTLTLIVVVLASMTASARIAYVGFGRHDVAELVAAQLRWLEPRVGPAAGGTSQSGPAQSGPAQSGPAQSGGVPSGVPPDRDDEVLQLGFTALATARDDTRPVQARLPVLRAALARLDAPAVRARYEPGGGAAPGAFLGGWSLLVAGEVARLSGDPADLAALRARGAPWVAALGANTSGVLVSAGEAYRPVDTVVLAAALRRADAVAALPGAAAAIDAWLPRLEPLRDPTTKLLPHRTDAAGRAVEGPRATSQAMIQVFWPTVDVAGGTSSRDWVAFENTFLCPRLGLAAVCEFPGGAGAGDDLSGPLIAGVSPVATVLTLGAARAHGNTDLAEQISREVELFGAPVVDDGGRRYLPGSGPVADAVLAWSRAVPIERERPGVDDRDDVAWPGWTLCALIPGVLALGALAWRFLARRRFSGPLESDAAPPDSPYGGGGSGEERPASR